MFDDAGAVAESLVYQEFYVVEFEWACALKACWAFRGTGQRVFGANRPEG